MANSSKDKRKRYNAKHPRGKKKGGRKNLNRHANNTTVHPYARSAEAGIILYGRSKRVHEDTKLHSKHPMPSASRPKLKNQHKKEFSTGRQFTHIKGHGKITQAV